MVLHNYTITYIRKNKPRNKYYLHITGFRELLIACDDIGLPAILEISNNSTREITVFKKGA